MKKAFICIIALLIFVSCEKDENRDTVRPVTKENIQGKIEKGPFVMGSKVTLSELDEQLKQTGKNIFTTETTDDLGNFSFDSKMDLSSQFVELEINGYFFNEYSNRISDSQIKLNAIADISQRDMINVNILTHLEYKRIKKLVSEGVSFSKAKSQAKKELLKSFHITDEFANPEDISFFDGTEASTALLAISAILLQGRSEGEFSQFTSMLSNNFGEKGVIDNDELLGKIKLSSNNVNSDNAKSNMVNYYKEKGHTVNFGDLRKYIDHNGDGVLDDEDNYVLPNDTISSELLFDKEERTRAVVSSFSNNILLYTQLTVILDAIRSNHEIGNLHQVTSTSDFILSSFREAYRAISTFNIVIEGLQERSYTYDTKPYIATAKVLRALLYIDMVQHWGDMPLVVTSSELNNNFYPKRDSKEDIFAYFEKDLSDVKNDLSNEIYTYDNPIVPTALVDVVLATIALERKTDASAPIENIISSGLYKLEGTSVDLYNSINDETIFGLHTEQSVPSFFTEFKKGIYHPIIRYSGILLNYAESLLIRGNTAKALETINSVRSSKGLTPVNNGADLKKGIAATWKEVYGMDYGYFTLLKRLGLAEKELGISSYLLLLPIPQNELYANPNMTQNPGYN